MSDNLSSKNNGIRQAALDAINAKMTLLSDDQVCGVASYVAAVAQVNKANALVDALNKEMANEPQR